MLVKTCKKAVKAIALAQAVIAVGLLIIGALTKSKLLIKIGAVWCALVTVDSVRTTNDAIDDICKLNGWKDTDICI